MRSFAFRTDLMLLELQGSTVERRPGYRVVRTPDNPGFRWGNFLLADEALAAGSVSSWIDVFHDEFPGADYVAIGVDGVDGQAGDQAELAAARFDVEFDTVLTADAVRPPPYPNRSLPQRIADRDTDWHAALDLQESLNTDEDPVEFRTFAWRRLMGLRALQERGVGAWFGAFRDGAMVSGLGVYGDGSGIARFQNVGTHPDWRGRGLAGTLVHAASTYALGRLRAHTLVMVADPTDRAIRIYRALGFDGSETQVEMERR